MQTVNGIQYDYSGMLKLKQFSAKYGDVKAYSFDGKNLVCSALVGKNREYYRYNYQTGQYVKG